METSVSDQNNCSKTFIVARQRAAMEVFFSIYNGSPEAVEELETAELKRN